VVAASSVLFVQRKKRGPIFRDIPEIDRARIGKWLRHEMEPPMCPSEMPNNSIADVLQILIEQGSVEDGKTLWICEAVIRLRDGKKI